MVSTFRAVVIAILVVVWIAGSFGINAGMVDSGYVEWWQTVGVLALWWLLYAIVVRILYD